MERKVCTMTLLLFKRTKKTHVSYDMKKTLCGKPTLNKYPFSIDIISSGFREENITCKTCKYSAYGLGPQLKRIAKGQRNG